MIFEWFVLSYRRKSENGKDAISISTMLVTPCWRCLQSWPSKVGQGKCAWQRSWHVKRGRALILTVGLELAQKRGKSASATICRFPGLSWDYGTHCCKIKSLFVTVLSSVKTNVLVPNVFCWSRFHVKFKSLLTPKQSCFHSFAVLFTKCKWMCDIQIATFNVMLDKTWILCTLVLKWIILVLF